MKAAPPTRSPPATSPPPVPPAFPITLNSTDQSRAESDRQQKRHQLHRRHHFNLAAADDWDVSVRRWRRSMQRGSPPATSRCRPLPAPPTMPVHRRLVVTGTRLHSSHRRHQRHRRQQVHTDRRRWRDLHADRHGQRRDHVRHQLHADAERHRQGRRQPDREQERHQLDRRHHLQPGCGRGLGRRCRCGRGRRRHHRQRGHHQQCRGADHHLGHLRRQHRRAGGHRHRFPH